MSGAIPPELGNLANLQVLSLNSNGLSGAIPPELGNLANLQRLEFSRNELSGELPPELGGLPNLTQLGLGKNYLSGEIPQELGNLLNLEMLLLGSNQLSGCIPSGLRYVSQSDFSALGLPFCALSTEDAILAAERAALKAFYAATNGADWHENRNWLSDAPLGEWHGVTTDDSGRVIGLSLLDNQLSGEIPPELGGLSNLADLYLSGNQLSGCIPSGLRYVPQNDFSDMRLPFCG